MNFLNVINKNRQNILSIQNFSEIFKEILKNEEITYDILLKKFSQTSFFKLIYDINITTIPEIFFEQDNSKLMRNAIKDVFADFAKLFDNYLVINYTLLIDYTIKSITLCVVFILKNEKQEECIDEKCVEEIRRIVIHKN